MRKLLLAVGETELKGETLDFACYLARLTKSGLTGIFLETLECEEAIVTSMHEDMLQMRTVKNTNLEGNETVRAQCRQRINRFRDGCVARDVVSHVHLDRGVPWKELTTESRYADALIVDAAFTLDGEKIERTPTHDVKKLLHESECPVIIAPPGFEEVDEIVMAYDGSMSSVFAIRQFIHLFPEFSEKKVVILEIIPTEEGSIDEKYRLSEWLKNYFTDIEFVLLEGEPENRLLEYLLSHRNVFVTMGGYGRDRLSRLLQPSASATIIKLLAAAIFIAHH